MRKLKKPLFCNIFNKTIIMIEFIHDVSEMGSCEVCFQHEYNCTEEKDCPKAFSPDCPVNNKNTS